MPTIEFDLQSNNVCNLHKEFVVVYQDAICPACRTEEKVKLLLNAVAKLA